MEQIDISLNLDKSERYRLLALQIESLVAGEKNMIANMANIAAALRETFNFFWVGFYLCDSDKELVLGPFQGPVACPRIAFGKGVCGTAWAEQRLIIVPDVDKFPGHIACSSASKSEIVVPVFANNKVFAVLDIDSDKLNSFDDTDRVGLEKIVKLINL